MIEKKEKNHSNTFYQKIRKTAKTLEIEIVKKNRQRKTNMEKRSEGENDIKGKKKIMIEEMTGQTKFCTTENNKWGKSNFLKRIKDSNSGKIKYVTKIRLNIWELKGNYGRKSLNNRCHMSQ